MLRKVHEASYSNRTWVPKLAMAKVAGHCDGFVQLYRAGIWCSIEQDAVFKRLFDRITPVSNAQLTEAEAFMEGRRSWAGVRATPFALRNYTDVILQDLVEWCAHPIKGPDYLAATDRFPFLAAKGWQHADWLRFFSVNSAKAAVMRVADRQAALQEPQTPPGLRPVQQLLANPAAIIDLIQEVPGAPAAPSGGWTAADVYARDGEPLKAGVPSLKGSMVQQVGHSNC